MRAGRATFLIKVKSHRGEPINERTDTLAEEGLEICDDNQRWDVRTDCMTFEVQKGNTTVRSVWMMMMMMTFICSCRNNNQPNAIYPLYFLQGFKESKRDDATIMSLMVL